MLREVSLNMRCHAYRVVAAVKHNKLRVEEDVAPDLKGGRRALDAAEANYQQVSISLQMETVSLRSPLALAKLTCAPWTLAV